MHSEEIIRRDYISLALELLGTEILKKIQMFKMFEREPYGKLGINAAHNTHSHGKTLYIENWSEIKLQ